MYGKPWIWAVVFTAMGALQAWDSGVLGSTALVQGIVAVAILAAPAALLASRSHGVHVAAVAVAFVLLTIARIIAPAPLPTLHIIAFMPAVAILMTKLVRAGNPAVL